MNRELRAEILDAARALFNERGFSDVSMRDVAGALEISVGNLTYYFRTKEALVEAAVLEKAGSGHRFQPVGSLEGLDGFFHRVLSYQEKNAFYFKNYQQLALRFPKVYEMQMGVMREMHAMLEETFAALRERGILTAGELSDQYDRTIDALMSIATYALLQEPERKYLCLWGVMYPLLTQKGKAEYRLFKTK